MLLWVLLSYYSSCSRRRLLRQEILEQVHDALIAQSKASQEALRGYPVDNLRDHIFDVIGLSGSKRRSVAKKIWPKVVELIQADSRIRERTIMHRGRQTTIWEWIAPDLTPSERRQRRRSKTPDAKKTLDFGTSLPVQGDATLLY